MRVDHNKPTCSPLAFLVKVWLRSILQPFRNMPLAPKKGMGHEEGCDDERVG